mgnify:FL=1
MPELPEVETVRRGLSTELPGKKIKKFDLVHPGGNRQGSDRPWKEINGARIIEIKRRGKFLWLVLDRDCALVGHLGMSGQMLIRPKTAEYEKHLRIRIDYGDKKNEFRFVDQRTFGWMALDDLVASPEGLIPRSFARIAFDIFDPEFDRDKVISRIRRSKSQIKRVLLDQGIISGIGNIYADEALWLAKIHPEQTADRLSEAEIRTILNSVRRVMKRAVARGGTSFDDLYINVNGESGYFEISLNAYGREGDPCRRCRTAIRRISFANRSSHFCPRCQKNPGGRRTGTKRHSAGQ